MRKNSDNFHLSSSLSFNDQYISLHPDHFFYHFYTLPQNKASHQCQVDAVYIYLFLNVYFLQIHLKMNLHLKIKKYHDPTSHYLQTLLCKLNRFQIYIYHNHPFFLYENCHNSSLHLGRFILLCLLVQTQEFVLYISIHLEVISLESAYFEFTEIDAQILYLIFTTKVSNQLNVLSNFCYKLSSFLHFTDHFDKLYHFQYHRFKETKILPMFIDLHSILGQNSTNVTFHLSQAL